MKLKIKKAPIKKDFEYNTPNIKFDVEKYAKIISKWTEEAATYIKELEYYKNFAIRSQTVNVSRSESNDSKKTEIYSLVKVSRDYDRNELHKFTLSEFILSTTKKKKIYEAVKNLRSCRSDRVYFENNKEDVSASLKCNDIHWFVYVDVEE